MVTPHSPWPRTLTLYERHVIGALAYTMLPVGRESPVEAGIADFFDDWLSAPYPQQVADKKQILSGLETLDRIAQMDFGSEFAQLTDKQKTAVLDAMINNGDDGRLFFLRFRYLVIGGYYTTDIGMRLLGYRGNVPLRKPKEIQADVLTVAEAELRKLGL
ncbi:gluconate 2-dehydrogenase subunit 3 family protein [Rhizobium ruizarguesonis]|uniref:gluconate 2-dehydrogenase subunit 3 family protein n=1 Tax=Rhizobium ruizarguesonis TaxID=2081791 RepID=UPI0013EEBCF7|nr:gluconate 2-dehydrogenase subunit 3 family protein [Rhizobium ruizarguesonis]